MRRLDYREQLCVSELIEEISKDWLAKKWHAQFREDCELLVKVAERESEVRRSS